MTSKEIQWAIAKSWSSPFNARANLAVVPNVSWGFGLLWEADLIICKKSLYLTEIEIKVSLADWKIDKLKRKFDDLGKKETPIKNFYYAAPLKLAKRFEELNIPVFAGVIGINEEQVSILRPAKTLEHRKITDKEARTLLRLAALKAWGMEMPPPKQLELIV